MQLNWDERYRAESFAYGKAPNQFLKEWLPQFKPGSILVPADGEGRNGVFAAKCGWEVTSCDLSSEGKSKALRLASEEGVSLDYKVGDLDALDFDPKSFDAIALIYAHFSADRKEALHQKLDTYLKKGGVVIFEAFSKNHLALRAKDPKVGGPGNIDQLFSLDEIKHFFGGYEILTLKEELVVLAEGQYHNGQSSVIRFVGKKT